MTILWAHQALLANGWARDVRVEIGDDGTIQSVTPNSRVEGNQIGILLPAPVNAHSHAFQRAMAGLTERRGPDPTDSFWTWRQLMFRFLDQLTPVHIEAITAFTQMEMLEAGYATNVEFHYLHHQPGGQPYDNIAELSERIAAAASRTGIGLTLLPVHYQYGGCDKSELGPGQSRFGNDFDRFSKLFSHAEHIVSHLPADCRIGLAPHSLRAVAREDLSRLADLAAGRPIHMHLAEQQAEVEEVAAAWGARPVEWALDNLDLSAQWCMIHCTQMLPHETERLAKTGAVAGLCPITEASLGDGIFDGVSWSGHDGAIAIGSDSNIKISLAEEIRTLDYSQRLRDHSRAALATPDKSTGRFIFDALCSGGAKAANRNTGSISAGFQADLMVLDHRHVDFIGRDADQMIDSFVFAGRDSMVTDVWSAGRHMVRNGQHIHHAAITRDYAAAIRQLSAVI